MKLDRSSETSKTITFQTESSWEEICERTQQVIFEFKNRGTQYFFKNPLSIFREIDYYRVLIKREYIYFPMSIMSPAIYVYFEQVSGERNCVLFKSSYLPVFRWAFYVTVPITGYLLYQAVRNENRVSVIAFAIGFGLFIWLFIASIAYVHEKWNSHFFKRDVGLIVRDMSGDSLKSPS